MEPPMPSNCPQLIPEGARKHVDGQCGDSTKQSSCEMYKACKTVAWVYVCERLDMFMPKPSTPQTQYQRIDSNRPLTPRIMPTPAPAGGLKVNIKR